MEKVLTIDLNSNPIQTPMVSDKLMEELDRMRSENEKLSDMLILARRNYDDVMMMKGSDMSLKTRGCKRKPIDGDNCEYRCGSNHASKVYVRIDPSDVSLVVKDGYHWRKYGQKVTRDNPSPRAYYKCSLSPACPAKKKVQRSVDDPSLLVAMYEGQHQHPASSSHVEMSKVSGIMSSPTSTTNNDFSSSSLENRDLKDPTSTSYSKIQSFRSKDGIRDIDHKFLAVEMASLLTRNHAFIDALAAAVTGKILDEVMSENNKAILE